jgi:hypothetical protein
MAFASVEPVSLTARRDQSISARRAARRKRAEREMRIVRFLNAGVSVSEIAAREGLTQRRMRAVVQEVRVKRLPQPPAEFLALQVSRLNEALFASYSAMSGSNLGAVDRVVKIVRELDRYHGFPGREVRAQDHNALLEPQRAPLALQPQVVRSAGNAAAND